jgi:D-aminopeptidase
MPSFALPLPARLRLTRRGLPLVLLLAATTSTSLMAQQAMERPRARELGVAVGILPPGPLNAITDVRGVRVGQVTVIEGTDVRTGVTAVLPHGGNLYHDRVPAALHVINGFGKLVGATQLRELGELETPILLTCTLCVWQAADAMTGWLLRQPGMDDVRSINPVVGETGDGFLNDIRSLPLRGEHVVRALESASNGPVAEGAVGAGTGTVAFGWKGGIGTSSRRLPPALGGHTVGVLVQSNFGGALTINGAPVGRELGRYPFQRELEAGNTGDGSIMIVVATDAPLDARMLQRLAVRAGAGLARTGAAMTHGSGDYVIAFSVAEAVRRGTARPATGTGPLAEDTLSPLFQAVAEATEEAIYNSLFRAIAMQGHRGAVEALPLDRVTEILRRYGVLELDRRLPPGAPPRR